MSPGQIVGELLSVALAIGKEASAAEQADILARLDRTRDALAALPSLAAAVSDAAEKRRRELAGTDHAPPEGE